MAIQDRVEDALYRAKGIYLRGRGGIGRRCRLKICWALPVRVRFPPSLPSLNSSREQSQSHRYWQAKVSGMAASRLFDNMPFCFTFERHNRWHGPS
jgi:hypothetical protein